MEKDFKNSATKKKTVFISFFGGPGTGKSTTATGLFSLLKKRGKKCEYISEFAKELVWEEHSLALDCQPLIVGEQIFRQHKLDGKLDLVITDSPLIINLLHDGFGVTENYKKWIIEVFNMFHNINFLLVVDRTKRVYEADGRTETEEKALQMDRENLELLINNKIPFIPFSTTENTEIEILKYLEDNNLI